MTYRPWTTRTVGIEMEIRNLRTDRRHLSQSEVIAAVSGCGLTDHQVGRQHGYYHSDGSTWDIKTDSSCGFEVASPALRLNDAGHNADLKKVCAALGSLHPSVDKQCGLHVHVECSDLTWQQLQKLVALWARYEPFFFSLCPKSRATNQYCQPLRKTAWDGPHSNRWHATQTALSTDEEAVFKRNAASERRAALNLSTWWRTGRVEFRLQGGTINYEKIRMWTILLTALVNRVKNDDAPAIALTIGVQPDTGFATAHVLAVLGLRATAHFAPPAALSEKVTAWTESRMGSLHRTVNA